VVATFTDLKSRRLRGHAEGVAELADAAAWRLKLTANEVTRVRRAALSLDLGRVCVSNAIWERPGTSGLGDWERVQLHPYFTERAFAHSEALAPIGALASADHERVLSWTGMRRVGRASSPTPEVPPIMQEAGHKGRPQAASSAAQYDA
jgi:HD-GYP domain-containing protein (c-di-GMP phosphodiesterase class II)